MTDPVKCPECGEPFEVGAAPMLIDGQRKRVGWIPTHQGPRWPPACAGNGRYVVLGDWPEGETWPT